MGVTFLWKASRAKGLHFTFLLPSVRWKMRKHYKQVHIASRVCERSSGVCARDRNIASNWAGAI